MSEKSEALLLSVKEAAEFIGISRSLFYELHAEGKVPAPVRLGRRVLWRRDELKDWVIADCPGRLEWEQMQTCEATR